MTTEQKGARSLVAVDCGINLKPTASVAQQDIHREKMQQTETRALRNDSS